VDIVLYFDLLIYTENSATSVWYFSEDSSWIIINLLSSV